MVDMMRGAQRIKLCDKCLAEGKTSTISIGYSTVTASGIQTYYDKQGFYHHHDPNRVNTRYACSNGHRWSEAKAPRCAQVGCDFGAGQEDRITWEEPK